MITNQDPFDWTDVELEINGGLISSGYLLSTDRIPAGETVSVGALQFADGDGSRFNPMTMKPQSFRIRAYMADGRRGAYSAAWD